MIEDRAGIEAALNLLGRVLAARGQRFEIVAVGGSGLMLLGLISRATKDLDVVALVQSGTYVKADPLPSQLVQAAKDVAEDTGLRPEWLNAGPASLLDDGLPVGFEGRVEIRDYGGLVVHLASRFDQIHLKLYATEGPHGKHFDDLRRLNPGREELLAAARWARERDPSEVFRQDLVAVIRILGVDDAYAVI